METGATTDPLVIALTGGIASGKTAVSDQFAALGATVVDTDILAREVVAQGSEGLRGIVDLFGSDVLRDDGQLDRSALREVVFAEPKKRKALESLLHPLIRSEGAKRIAAATGPYVIYVIPLLLETGAADQFDRVLLVDVPVEVQKRRLMERNDLDSDRADSMISAQTSRAMRQAAADDLICNDRDLEYLHAQVARLHTNYLTLAGKKALIPATP